jgi:hypothetical protein
MTNKRVGTITAGIFMIVLGIVLLLSLTVGKKMSLVLIDFWPAFIILLGLEILYHHYRSSDVATLHYDIASMFILLIFGLTAIGLYSLQASGVLSVIDELGRSSSFTVDISKHNIPIERDINKIVIENESRLIAVKVQDRPDVAIDSNLEVFAPNRKSAEEFASTNQPFSIVKQGEELLIKTRPVYTGRWVMRSMANTFPITVTVPSNIALDVISNQGNTSLVMDSVNSNCFIKQNDGEIDVTAPEKCNLDIIATAQFAEGNVKFRKAPVDTQAPDRRSDSTETGIINTGETSNAPLGNYKCSLGKGGAKLNLISLNGNVVVCTK